MFLAQPLVLRRAPQATLGGRLPEKRKSGDVFSCRMPSLMSEVLSFSEGNFHA